MQYGPGQACILRGDGNDGAPVAPAFRQAAGPAAEAVLFVAGAVENGACAQDEQTSQVGITGLGDVAESGFAPAAVLAGGQSDPGGNLATIPEVMAVADAGQQCAGGDGADAGLFHQSLAARVFARSLCDGSVVVGDARIELVGMRQEITDTLVGITGKVFKMRANTLPQTTHFLRQDDAEFGNQAAQAVIGGGAFFNKTLPGTVQAQDDLLVFFLDGDKAHLGTGDGLSDGGGVRCVVLAAFTAHAVGGDEFGCDQFDGVAMLADQAGPVVGTGAGQSAVAAVHDLPEV